MGRTKGSKNKVRAVKRTKNPVVGQGKRGRKPRAENETVLYDDAKWNLVREPLNYRLTQKNPHSTGYYTSLNGVFMSMLDKDDSITGATEEGIKGIIHAVEKYKTYVTEITKAMDKKITEVMG